MSNTYPPPPPPGGQDPQPYGQQDGQTPPPPPPPYGQQPGGSVPPPPAPAYGEQAGYQQPGSYGQQPGGYGQMPGAPMSGAPTAAAVARPPAMDNAVKLMRLGGIMSLVSVLLLFFTTGATRDAIEKSIEETGKAVDQTTVDAAVAFTIGLGVFSGLIGVALWFWMAAMNGKGRSWARIVATIFFAIQVLTGVYSLLTAGAILSKLVALIMLVIGAGAIWFMYRPESSQFYQSRSRPQY